jgi:hypothetical protein
MRHPLRAPFAAALALTFAVGGALVSCGSGPTYSLDEALKPASASLGTTFQAIVGYDEQQTQVSGGVDASGEHARLKMDLGGGFLGGAPIEAVIDIPNAVIYMGADFFKVLGATIDTPWVKIDRAALEASGEDTAFFDQLKLDDPRDTTALLRNATDVKDLGMVTLEDEDPMRHYQVTVPSKDVLAKNPALAQTIDAIEGTLPDDIVYDVYVTKSNAVRNISFTLDLDVTTLTSEVWIDELTKPVQIDLPGQDESIDITDVESPSPTTP